MDWKVVEIMDRASSVCRQADLSICDVIELDRAANDVTQARFEGYAAIPKRGHTIGKHLLKTQGYDAAKEFALKVDEQIARNMQSTARRPA